MESVMKGVKASKRMKCNDSSECDEHLRALTNLDEKKICCENKNLLDEEKLDEISDHIQNFHYWNCLPLGIQHKIVENVDFVARFSLLRCSKSMQRITRTVPIHVKSINIKETESEDAETQTKVYNITIIPNLGRQIRFQRLKFVPNSASKKFSRKWIKAVGGGRDTKFFMFCDYKTSSSLLKKISEFFTFEVDELTVCITERVQEDIFPANLKIKKELKIVNVFEYDILTQWLYTTESPLEEVFINFYSFYDDTDDYYIDIPKHETVRNAKKLKILPDAHIFEYVFTGLMCEELHINLSFRGTNEFLKKWVESQEWINLKALYICHEYCLEDENVVLENVPHARWSSKFRKRNRVLCQWIDEKFSYNKMCYYIESKIRDIGATLIRSRFECIFLVTGKSVANLRTYSGFE